MLVELNAYMQNWHFLAKNFFQKIFPRLLKLLKIGPKRPQNEFQRPLMVGLTQKQPTLSLNQVERAINISHPIQLLEMKTVNYLCTS